MANRTEHFAAAARRATARGDHALAAAINALPAVAVADDVTYAALTEPVAAAIAAAEPDARDADRALDRR